MRIQYFMILFLGGMTGLWAQPETALDYCHHANQAIPWKEPTLEELLLMENSNKRSDSIDVLNYTIRIDVTNYRNRQISAHTTVDFRTRLDGLEWITLDLRNLTIDSIVFEAQPVSYSYDGEMIRASFGRKLPAGQNASLEVYYRGSPSRDPVWGGFYFADPYIYNLGIGLSSTPPNFGKVWYPCFDNFVERSTYEYIVTSLSPARAYCVGTFMGEDSLSDHKLRRSYLMTDPIPTYLSSIAVSDYSTYRYEHKGSYDRVPVELISRSPDLEKMKTQFSNLPGAIDAFEFWYGPYRFERVGFVTTTVGAMEHPTNTAYPVSSINSGTLAQNERLMAHEFGHQWWGNLTTLDDARDMWIKEGTAEYSSHLFFEFVYGKKRFLEVVKDNLGFILFNAHVNDSAFLPLSPMPYSKTYGTHTYRKGAAMIHNLRTYLGDSMYRKACHMIFDSLTGTSMNAFQFRDFLNRNTGMDLTHYFNDHIFNRGYCAFYADSFSVVKEASGNYAELTIMQKDYHADHLFTEAPVFVSFYDRGFNRLNKKFLLTGPVNRLKVELPDGYLPEMVLVNEQQELNLASLQDNAFITRTGSPGLIGTGMTPGVSELSDSAYLNIVHHLVAPSEGSSLQNVLRLNPRHFWQVNAIAKGNLLMTGRLDYNGAAGGLDEDLNVLSEDSVILAYRKDWTEPWREFGHYTRQKLTPSDKRGFLRIDRLLPGEYCIAYGHSSLVNTRDRLASGLSVYPNPAVSTVCVDLPDHSGTGFIYLTDLDGKRIINQCLDPGVDSYKLDVGNLPCGTYELCLANEAGVITGCEELQLVH